MPASLLELKKKIASVKQTGKITEAWHYQAWQSYCQKNTLSSYYSNGWSNYVP